MMMEWEYDPDQWGVEKKDQDKKFRGLRDNLEYDETFYIALIKNYQDMGWFPQADDAYYTYRVLKRKRREKDTSQMEIFKGTMEYLFLELPFGYGVKPSKLFYTFILLCLFFSIGYLPLFRKTNRPFFSLRGTWTRFRSYMRGHWWKPWKHVDDFLLLVFVNNRFAWALIHSLDNITPGINFQSIKTMSPYAFIEPDSRRRG